MGKLVVLKSTGGEFERGFVVTVSIAEESAIADFEGMGNLPPNAQIEECYGRWKNTYGNLGLNTRLFATGVVVRKSSPLHDCQRSAEELEQGLNQWLRSEAFLPIRDLILAEVKSDEDVRFVIQVDHPVLQQLPWALWELFDRYQNAEVAIAAPTFQRKLKPTDQSHSKVKILAILGDRTGIDIERDRAMLENLPNADVLFLVEPQRQDLADRLWEQSWDILFFAGHSITQQEKGYFYLNQTDRLSIEDLKYVLKRAVDRGLNLAIFNSCDGFGLAKSLGDLQIPQIIFMREPVPDRVAQLFLQYFLAALSQGESLYLAVRHARERLKTLESHGSQETSQLESSNEFGVFPCASWLPLIFQNLAVTPPTWLSLQNIEPSTPIISAPDLPTIQPQPIRKPLKKRSLLAGFTLSLIVGSGVCWVRSQGWLQALELKAYDHVMQVRSSLKSDPVDERLMVITIDDSDAQRYGDPKSDLSVTDANLLALLNKLQQAKAKVIGLDLIRDSSGVDPKVVRAFQQMNNVQGVCVNSMPDHPGFKAPQGLDRSPGFADMAHDSSDGSTRRLLLALPIDPESPCQTTTSFSLSLAAKYLGQKPDDVIDELPIVNGGDRPGAYYQSKDQESLNMRLYPHVMMNYRNAKIPNMSMSDVLQERSGRLNLSDRIVVVGITRSNKIDIHTVPIGKSLDEQGKQAGVWIQAEKAGYIVNLIKRERSAIVIPDAGSSMLSIVLVTLIGTALAFGTRTLKWRMVSSSGLWVLMYGATIVAFFQGAIWIPIVPLWLGSFVGIMSVSCINSSVNLLQFTRGQGDR